MSCSWGSKEQAHLINSSLLIHVQKAAKTRVLLLYEANVMVDYFNS